MGGRGNGGRDDVANDDCVVLSLHDSREETDNNGGDVSGGVMKPGGFPPQLTQQEITSAAPPQLRINEVLGNSISSPTSDLDIDMMLLNLPFSPGRIVEDLPQTELTDEAKNHHGASGHDVHKRVLSFELNYLIQNRETCQMN